jgi:hypothetical protein
MRLKFRLSHIYNKHLKPDLTSVQWKRVKKLAARFLNVYHAEIKKIILLLPKIAGKSWPEEDGNELEVYFVSWKGPSFSHPLTLKVREDLLLMLIILTHELGHHFFEKETKETERKVNALVEKIFKKLNIAVDKQMTLLRTFTEK